MRIAGFRATQQTGLFQQPARELSAAERYVVLALAAEELATDHCVVFTYFGPASLRRLASRRAAAGIASIVSELSELEAEVLEAVDDTPPLFRQTYLHSQIRSLRALLEASQLDLTGVALVDAVTRILGLVPPPPYPLPRIRQDEAAVFTRYGYDSFDAFLARQEASPKERISDRRLRSWINVLISCFTRDIAPHVLHGNALARTLARSPIEIAPAGDGLPPDYYMYEGRWRGRMCLGEDYRNTPLTATRTIMHELCPGHHISYLYRELLYRMGLVGVEATVDLLLGSETPIAEGVAEMAPNYMTSLQPALAEQIHVTNAREHVSKKYLYNVWHSQYVSGEMSREDAREYLIREGGFASEKIDVWLQFVDGWRVYFPAYPIGTERIKATLTGKRAADLMLFYLPKSLPVLDAIDSWRRKSPSSLSERHSPINLTAIASPRASAAEKGDQP